MDLDVVRKVASIARLDLTAEELEDFSRDLEEILEYFSVLDQAPAREVHRLNPVEIEDVFREDGPYIEVDPEELKKLMNTYEEWVRGPRLS